MVAISVVKNKNSAGGKTFVAQAVALADLVDYQEGSVVSRTVIDKKAGTVTLFAFDKDEGLSEHTAPYDALVYVFDGEADIIISGKPVRVKQGEMTIMPAKASHALKAVTKFKMLLVMVRS
jgi:quercetin dioxygenase-like cupin family protein